MALQIDSTLVENSIFTTPNVIGWVLSSLICIILTVLIYPYLEDSFQSFVVKKLNFLKLSSGHKIAGLWTHRWHVKSKNFQPINEIKQVEIKQFRKRVFAQYKVKDNDGKIFTYQLLGKVDKDQVITGIWKDIENGNRYHGCFQIYIDINEQTMHGYWTGLSRNQNIKSDKWEWIRE
jgi:hypothetical protein